MAVYLKPSVRNQIPQQLNRQDREIVERCVFYYSKSILSPEAVAYRLSQSHQSYPDWKKSIELLEQRKIIRLQDEETPTAMSISLVAPWNYALQESGLAKLQKLIRENS